MTGTQEIMSANFSTSPPFTSTNPPLGMSGNQVLDYSLTPPSGSFYTIGTINVGTPTSSNLVNAYWDGTAEVVACQ